MSSSPEKRDAAERVKTGPSRNDTGPAGGSQALEGAGARRFLPWLYFLISLLVFGGIGVISAGGHSEPQEREITIRAFKYGYDPAIIRVNRGDKVKLTFVSEDVVHGFYLEGHNLNVTIIPLRSKVQLRREGSMADVGEVAFTAQREGKFRYRCSETCGFLHPFMLGEFIVSPNRLFPASLGLAVGILVGGLALGFLKEDHT